MRTDDLDFYLPAELIAQTPPPQRSAARLLHYQRSTQAISHRVFSDLPGLLNERDLLVFNNAKVIPARFTLRKSSGGRVEALFLRQTMPGRWRVLLRNAGNIGPVQFADDPALSVRIIQSLGKGEFEIEVGTDESAEVILDRIGRMPLPPYIKREKDHDPRDEQDRRDYQTLYATVPGSVAAPTAGLHFTPELQQQLIDRGIQSAAITLHVGMGTFKPVTAQTLDQHVMHTERYEISESAAQSLNAAQAENRRIVAVGTTSARVLESWPDQPWKAASGETSILIYPPYLWKRVGALITNFHLPRSTLIALVAAMVGLEEQRRIYRTAIQDKYRFYSYGDALLIE